MPLTSRRRSPPDVSPTSFFPLVPGGFMFRRLPEAAGDTIAFTIDGQRAQALAGDTVAAALLSLGIDHCRTTPGVCARRAPYCMMGVCCECRVTIDGVGTRQACMI